MDSRGFQGVPRTNVSATVQDVPFRLVRRRWLSPAVAELELAPVAAPVHFVSGQYVQVCDLAYRLPPRSYSLAHAPRHDRHLLLLVTAVPSGPVSSWLTRQLPVGQSLLVSGAYGCFGASLPTARPVLALAGGSGWAPMRALAQEAAGRGFATPFSVLFSARTPADRLDSERIGRWERAYANFRYDCTLTRAPGPLSGRIPDVLSGLYPQLAAHAIYIAGPPPLVAACVTAVRALGATAGQVHTEVFYSDPEPW